MNQPYDPNYPNGPHQSGPQQGNPYGGPVDPEGRTEAAPRPDQGQPDQYSATQFAPTNFAQQSSPNPYDQQSGPTAYNPQPNQASGPTAYNPQPNQGYGQQPDYGQQGYGQQGQPGYGQEQQPGATTPFGQPGAYSQPGQQQGVYGQQPQQAFGQPGAAPYGQPVQSPYGQPGQPPFGQPGSQKKNKTTLIVVLAAVLAIVGILLALGAYFIWGPKNLDQTAVQNGVTQVLTDDYQLNADDISNVSCPSGQSASEGTTFTCSLSVGGQNQNVTVTVLDSDGTYEVSRPSS